MSSYLEFVRNTIEEQYFTNPTGCGGSFGELLCYEIHTNHLTFKALADKWGISISTMGDLIADHCKRLEEIPKVNHSYE